MGSKGDEKGNRAPYLIMPWFRICLVTNTSQHNGCDYLGFDPQANSIGKCYVVMLKNKH